MNQKRPVCKTERAESVIVYSECGFSDELGINRKFLSPKDFNYWLETVVKPHSELREAKKQKDELQAQQREVELLKQLKETNKNPQSSPVQNTQSTAFIQKNIPVIFNVDGGNGTLEAEVDGVKIKSGDSVLKNKKITFTSNPNKGFYIKSWLQNNINIKNKKNTYELPKMTSSVIVTVKYLKRYDITFKFEMTLFIISLLFGTIGCLIFEESILGGVSIGGFAGMFFTMIIISFIESNKIILKFFYLYYSLQYFYLYIILCINWKFMGSNYSRNDSIINEPC